MSVPTALTGTTISSVSTDSVSNEVTAVSYTMFPSISIILQNSDYHSSVNINNVLLLFFSAFLTPIAGVFNRATASQLVFRLAVAILTNGVSTTVTGTVISSVFTGKNNTTRY
ncbi:hypothetical protein RRG08_021156 [Elysia crispata]|uniref:Uncharacterized protein n=1 Tax=Elysia crispata TaxID=231223 RepID=A0AAE1DB21_9GAST|nr:hypothetical protein RRG08_021156 [Elysia crispata]